MRAKTFRKGGHPPQNKEQTHSAAIMPLLPGQTVIIPLLQHTGAAAEPLVKKGDRVLRGQKLGEARGLISAPVHASVSGTVKAVQNQFSPAGIDTLSLVIENDGQNEWFPGLKPLKTNLSEYSPDDIRRAVREAGIVGLGGAAFPTAVKLSPPKEYPIDTLIINGAECEPYLAADYRLMIEKPDEIIAGAELVQRAVNARRIYLGIEENKSEAIALLQEKLKNRSDFSVVALKTKYPQGSEKMLIKAILKREVPAGGLPFHVGALVQNVGTVFAIFQALSTGMPLIERVVTVAGSAINEPKNLLLAIGTLIRDVISGCGGSQGKPTGLIMGGPMMGIAQWSQEIPVIKATSGILLTSNGDTQHRPEYPCIRCNNCVNHCPMMLVPTRLATYIKFKNFDAARGWGIMDCMECGTCAYLCPAAIPLVQWIRLGKFEFMRMARKMESSA